MDKICVNLYGDGSRKFRLKKVTISCDRYEQCSFYKEGKCACVSGFLTPHCPYGHVSSTDGGTKQSKAYRRVYDEAKADPVYAKLKYPYGRYIADFGDTVGLSVPYADATYNDNNFKLDTLILSISAWCIIPKEEFTSSTYFLKRFYEYKAIGWNCSPIQKYRTESLPMFFRQVRKMFPELYAKFIEEVPEAAKLQPNYIGKIAKLSTVNRDMKYEGFHFEGDEIVNDEWRSAFLPFQSKTGSLRMKVTDSMTVTITDNDQVLEETAFV